MTERKLPGTVVTELNALGFVLVDGKRPYTFLRVSTSGEIRLRVQAIPRGRWLVEVAATSSAEGGRLLPSFPSVLPSRFGIAVDGATVEVSDAELRDQLPRMLATSLLPTWDSAWHEG
jgi:hypothetical protein